MASSYQKTPIGTRIGTLRRTRGYPTAESLADAIPDGHLSKSTIVNIEAGRKPDPSVREIMLIASALGVSIFEVLLDLENPNAPVEVVGLAEPYAGMSNIEYVAASAVLNTTLVQSRLETINELLESILKRVA